MKYSLRKSFSYRRRKETHDNDDEHVYPRINANGCSNSKLNLVKQVESKHFLQRRRRRRSSPPPPPPPPLLPSSLSSNKIKSSVFEPRYDIYSNEDDEVDDDAFSSSMKTPVRPLDRFTSQIRKSFRNTLTRQRSRLESTNSNKRLLLKKKDENHTKKSFLHPTTSIGLTSPLIIPNQNNKIKPSKKQRKATLAPTHMNQSISLPTEINPECQQSDYISSNDQQFDENNKQNLEKTTFNRSFRTRFSLLLKKRHENQPHEDINDENPNQKLTLGQRFNSLRHSFHLGNRNSSYKVKRHLLSND